ncbi:MAG: hypothetical protein CM15mP8_1820 [Methanobacteriota archaeon]|nr:MAG: hypothetical protein CM15mP8_1820 [Euryarchaeota archaeon]
MWLLMMISELDGGCVEKTQLSAIAPRGTIRRSLQQEPSNPAILVYFGSFCDYLHFRVSF